MVCTFSVCSQGGSLYVGSVNSITTRQLRCGKVMFSDVYVRHSVCLFTGGRESVYVGSLTTLYNLLEVLKNAQIGRSKGALGTYAPSNFMYFSAEILPNNRFFAKVMFLHLSVSHSVHRRKICIEGYGQTPPPGHWILWDTVNEWAVRIILECILVITRSRCC